MTDISQTIKRLRKEAGLSQENLAELLGITPAAVSKWENGVTMPDISQIVPLTTIFHVTADELLGIDSRDEKVEITQILTSIYKLEDVYPPEEGIEIVNAYRDALRKYPKNISLLSEALAFSVGLLCNYRTVPEKDVKPLMDDCTHWAELIMKHGEKTDTIAHAKCSLIDMYTYTGDWDKAEALAKALPGDLYRTRGYVLANLYHSAGKTEAEKKLRTDNIDAHLRFLVHHATTLGNRYRLEGSWEYALTCYRFVENILDSLYGNKAYRPPFIRRGLSMYLFPAECCLALGQTDAALDYVEKYAESYLAEREGFNRQTTVDSPLLRGNTYGYGFDGTASFTEYAARDLAYAPLAPLVAHPRFCQVKEKLGVE